MVNPEKIKCQIIKRLVEQTFHIENAGTRTRKRPYPEVKKIYASLCKKFTNAPLEIIGDVLGDYSHSNVLYLINSLDDLLETNGVDFIDNYIKLYNQLKEESDLVKSNDPDTPFTVLELNQKYRVQQIKICEKYRSIISNRDSRIKYLEGLLDLEKIHY